MKEDIRQVDLSIRMTGSERYPLIGKDNVSNMAMVQLGIVQSKFKGLSLYGSCVEKNWIARKFLPGFAMVMGDVRVVSITGTSAYGHDFNPPMELHAWLVNLEGIVADFALPGLILSGMNTRDEQGPFVEGREPSILIGQPPPWVMYKVRYVIDDAKVREALHPSSRFHVEKSA